MIVLAAALTLGINLQLDLASLVNRRSAGRTNEPKATCGIKVVGYHFTGKPGQQFQYAGETFTVPMEGFVEVISLPKVKSYAAAGQSLPLENGGALDGFSFRWIDLPTAAMQGGAR